MLMDHNINQFAVSRYYNHILYLFMFFGMGSLWQSLQPVINYFTSVLFSCSMYQGCYSLSLSLSLSIYIYIYIYAHTHKHTHIHKYINFHFFSCHCYKLKAKFTQHFSVKISSIYTTN